MLKKMKKGYYVKGHFVAEGSERDIELKRELKANSQIDPDKPSRTEQKAASDARQKLGVQLATLRNDLLMDLDLSDILINAVGEHNRITNFEGKRRQMQFIGKLMRKLDEAQIASIHGALKAQLHGAPRKIKIEPQE